MPRAKPKPLVETEVVPTDVTVVETEVVPTDVTVVETEVVPTDVTVEFIGEGAEAVEFTKDSRAIHTRVYSTGMVLTNY